MQRTKSTLALIKLEGPAIVSKIDRDLSKTLGIPRLVQRNVLTYLRLL